MRGMSGGGRNSWSGSTTGPRSRSAPGLAASASWPGCLRPAPFPPPPPWFLSSWSPSQPSGPAPPPPALPPVCPHLCILHSQVAEEEYLLQELRKIEARKKEREKRSQDLQKLITAADTTAEQRRTERKAPKKKLPQKKEAEKPVRKRSQPSSGWRAPRAPSVRRVCGTNPGLCPCRTLVSITYSPPGCSGDCRHQVSGLQVCRRHPAEPAGMCPSVVVPGPGLPAACMLQGWRWSTTRGCAMCCMWGGLGMWPG